MNNLYSIVDVKILMNIFVLLLFIIFIIAIIIFIKITINFHNEKSKINSSTKLIQNKIEKKEKYLNEFLRKIKTKEAEFFFNREIIQKIINNQFSTSDINNILKGSEYIKEYDIESYRKYILYLHKVEQNKTSYFNKENKLFNNNSDIYINDIFKDIIKDRFYEIQDNDIIFIEEEKNKLKRIKIELTKMKTDYFDKKNDLKKMKKEKKVITFKNDKKSFYLYLLNIFFLFISFFVIVFLYMNINDIYIINKNLF